MKESLFSTSTPNEELVTLDWRKGLARLAYDPGKVTFGEVLYDRQEMLAMQHKMLQKTKQLFHSMPGNLKVPESTVAATAPQPHELQPRAVGSKPGSQGSSSSARVSKSKEFAQTSAEFPCGEVAEDQWGNRPKLSSRGGSRQRPGSQGQPQAMGSRGTAGFGPLEEESGTLRLPQLAGESPGFTDRGGEWLTAR